MFYISQVRLKERDWILSRYLNVFCGQSNLRYLMVEYLKLLYQSKYQSVLDPLETLTYVAGNNERISLVTSIIDIFFHNPVTLARRFATLDVLSGGRVIACLGIGWSKDEYDAA